MEAKVSMQGICKSCENLVVREIHGEMILIPITNGEDDLQDVIFTLNQIGRAVWKKFNAKDSLCSIGTDLAEEFDTSLKDIEKDIMGFTKELLRRKILVEMH